MDTGIFRRFLYKCWRYCFCISENWTSYVVSHLKYEWACVIDAEI